MPSGVDRGRCRSFPQRRLRGSAEAGLRPATRQFRSSESAHPRRHGRLPQTRRLDRGRGLPGLSGLPRTEQGERLTHLPARRRWRRGRRRDARRDDRSAPSEPRASSTPGRRAEARSAPACVVRFASCRCHCRPQSEREGSRERRSPAARRVTCELGRERARMAERRRPPARIGRMSRPRDKGDRRAAARFTPARSARGSHASRRRGRRAERAAADQAARRPGRLEEPALARQPRASGPLLYGSEGV